MGIESIKLRIKSFFGSKPEWEKDFRKFAAKATEQDIDLYCSTFDKTGVERDYRKYAWGHTFSKSDTFKHQFITYGDILSSNGMDRGDTILMKTTSGKVGRFLVLFSNHAKNPEDMYWVYLVCTEYVNEADLPKS